MTSLVERCMRQWRIVVAFTVILVACGIYSFLTMQRQEFGDFTIRQGLVVGVMPGATTEEVEEQLTRPVEDYLFSFNEVKKKKTYTVSKDGLMIGFVELNDAVAGLEAPAFWAKLRHGLNELKAQLPSRVVALIGNSDFGDTSALIFTVVAENRSPRDLEKYVEVLESHLRRIDATAKLRSFGNQEEVIRVSISRERLTRYGIRPATVWSTLQGFTGAPAPARLDGDVLERPIHVRNLIKSEAVLGETILLSLPTGEHVRLKDVAEIKREYAHDEASVRFNGRIAMVLSIEMQNGNDITRFGDQVETALAATRAELPPDVTIARVVDQPQVVRTSINHFLRDFGLAIVSVIMVTMLLLPLRVASVAAITIPVCVAITLGVLNALGVKLETVSLAGLIVVLGMIVDNAIVVIDDHVDKLDKGMDRWTAAWKSARELTVPVLTATVAIALSYVPMPAFMVGMAGDFIGPLPLTIGVALATSFLVAILLVPAMNAAFIRRGLHRAPGRRRSMLDLLQGVFDRALEVAFRHPGLTLLGALVAVTLSLLIGVRLPQQMFPKVDRNQFAVEVYLPNGRSLKETDQVIRRLERELLADRRVTNVTAFVGQSSPRFHTVYAPQFPARNYGQLIVNTVDAKATEAVLHESETRLAGSFPEAWVRWKQLAMQLGNAVEVRLSGTEIADLKAAAKQVTAAARAIPGTTWVRDDFEEALQTIEVVPDADSAVRLGVPPAVLQMSLALGAQGFPVTTLWEGDYPVRVLLKDEPSALTGIEGLRQQYVSSMLGAASVPLEQLATIKPAWHEGAIVRRNGVRTLTVHIDVGMGVLASTVQQQMEARLAQLSLPGVRVEYGGEKELSEEVMPPFVQSMIASIILIFLVILIQFQRFRKAIVVMLSMPLALPGALLGLLLLRYPFGITCFVGIIGLFGLVIRNGIILVSYAEQLQREQGLEAKAAALAAGKRRMRPIYLTSMAAAIGVLPMVLGRSTLWGPLGTVTCFGLLFAMLMTLFVLPVMYWLVMRKQRVRAPALVQATTAGLIALLALVPSAASASEQPLSLDECKRMALKNNAQMQEAKLEIEAARETKKATYTKYFPQVSASAVGVLAAKPLVNMHTQGGDLPVYDGNPANLEAANQFAYMPGGNMAMAEHATVLSLMAVQPLYLGGRIRNGNHLAELGIEVAESKSALSARDVLAQTEEKYWRLVALGEKLNTLAAYENLLAALDRQVEDALRAGLLTSNDQLKVRLKRAEVAVDRQRLESGLRLASRDLRRHIGLPAGDAIAVEATLPAASDPASLRQEPAAAIDRRLETRLLVSAVRAEELQLSLKRGEMLPSASVGAGAFRVDVAGMPGATNALVFGMLSVPLSGIWEGVHATASARQRLAIARNRLDSTRDLLGLDIEKGWNDLRVAWQAVQVSEKSIEQSEVNVREVTDRYDHGMVPFSDVLEAEALRQQARDRRIDLMVEYWLKRSGYLRSIAADAESS